MMLEGLPGGSSLKKLTWRLLGTSRGWYVGYDTCLIEGPFPTRAAAFRRKVRLATYGRFRWPGEAGEEPVDF